MGMDDGNKKITIDDVAEALGVSITTISRAISGKGRISDKTRERVHQYIKEHNYKPNMIAQGLAQSKTYNIGVVMPDDNKYADMPFFQKCLFGISEMASSTNYDVLLMSISDNDVTQISRIIDNKKVDGVIVMRTQVKDPVVELLKIKQIPFVVIGRSYYEDVVQIDSDHMAGCQELTFLLLMKGLKKIALLGGDKNHVVNQLRLQGFEDGFAKSGYPVDWSMVRLDLNTAAQTDMAVEECLAAGADCFLCMDDVICGYVFGKLNRLGIRVPQDIKIASFHSNSVLEDYISDITSLRMDIRKLGSESCRMLMDKMNGKKIAENVLLGFQIILKRSTD